MTEIKEVPSFIEKMTSREAYMHGYSEGVCKGRSDKLIKVEDENCVPTFKFI